jgi:DNA-directed RNA polymerase subunit K/omega
MFTSHVLDQVVPGTVTSRITQPILTKYERANAIGTRARQIGQNYPVFVDVTGMEDEVAMARKELYAGKCPLIVRRTFPDSTPAKPHFEDWAVTELQIHHI